MGAQKQARLAEEPSRLWPPGSFRPWPADRPAPPPTYCSLLHRQLLPLKLSMENLMSEFQCWQRMWLTFTSWGAMRPKGLGLDPPQVSLSTLGP